MSAASSDSSPFSIADLVQPLAVQSFLRDYWQPGNFFLSDANPHLLDILGSFAELRGPRELTAALAARAIVPNHIDVFGPDQFRSEVPATKAMDFFHAGFTLYMAGIEKVAPGAAKLFAPVCAELGFLPRVFMEAFAAKAGAVSSWHYDHDINFQILLSGEKEWLVAPNTHIHNPLVPYHPSPGHDGTIDPCTEELYARDPAVPTTPLDHCRRVRATAGSVVFLPRACWHQTHAHTDCFGVNLVIKGKTWAAAITTALQYRLEAFEALRGYVAGLATAHTLGSVVEAMESQFPELKEIALRELQNLTLEEVPLSQANIRLQWAPDAHDRRLVEHCAEWCLELPVMFEEPVELESDLVPFMRQLVTVRGTFTWSQLLAIRGELQPTHLRALIETLQQNGILVNV